MSENLKLMRFFFVLLAIFTLGRWSLGLGGVSYDKAHQVFSIVILAFLASAHYGAFTRAFKGYSLGQAALLGASIGLASQLVILVSTAAAFMLDIQTYFNAPRALNLEEAAGFGQAMGIRLGGLVANTVFNGIAASLGWLFGAVLPKTSSPS